MLAEGGQEYGFVSFFPKAGEEGLGRMLQRYARAQRYAQVIELGCEGIPVVTVFNKCDKVPYINELDTSGEAVKISAKNGTGIDSLLAAIQKALPENSVRCRLLLPFDKAGLVNTIRQEGRIFSEDYTAEGIVLDALVDIKVYHLVESYKVKNEE